MKVYTKTGDKGTTALFGGARVPKNHIRIEAYGTVDELNSQLGLLRDHTKEAALRATLKEIQSRLFTVGAILATDPSKKNVQAPDLRTSDVVLLENEIDQMEQKVEPLRSFILPGGHPVVSYCHIARCVCRRAERQTVHLDHLQSVQPLVIQYLNRLSDYLFVLARYIAKIEQVEEVVWTARKSS